MIRALLFLLPILFVLALPTRSRWKRRQWAPVLLLALVGTSAEAQAQ